jgi:hypothetical protein
MFSGLTNLQVYRHSPAQEDDAILSFVILFMSPYDLHLCSLQGVSLSRLKAVLGATLLLVVT